MELSKSADAPWIRGYLLAASLLPVYAYMTYVAVKWAVIHAGLYLRQMDIDSVKAAGDLAMKSVQ